MIASKIVRGEFEWTKEHLENAALDNDGRFSPLNTYNAIGWWMLILGFLVRMSAFFGFALPVYPHEWFHGIAAVLTGGRVVEILPHHAIWEGGVDAISLAAGYFGELIVYGFIACAVPWRRLGKFCTGFVLWLPIEAMYKTGHSDFEQLGDGTEGIFVLCWIAAVCLMLRAQIKRGVVAYPPMPLISQDQPGTSLSAKNPSIR